MTELLILGVFALALGICTALGRSILWALLFGYALFFGYGLHKKHSPGQLLRWSLSGILTIKNILMTFVLIGVITAVWRSCGTIACIVYYATGLCTPRAMVLLTFLLCCLVSMLTGTSFGTAATVGVICMTMANSMGIPQLVTGGAVLAGSYFGDRCSPMSTSALLVSELTKTSLYGNIAAMLKTAAAPFLIACVIYLGLGFLLGGGEPSGSVREVFTEHFSLHPAVALPAAVILLLSVFRLNVKITMSASILTGAALALTMQHVPIGQLLHDAVFGYHPANPQLAALLSGGGIVSMARVFAIVCLSSSFAGLFSGTGFLTGISTHISALSRKITPFGGVLATAFFTSLIACNQTLAIMLTHQLCCGTEKNPEDMALDLENTAVVLAPLVPWSIAGAVPLATVAAPLGSIALAVYLYLQPVWAMLLRLHQRRKTQISL